MVSDKLKGLPPMVLPIHITVPRVTKPLLALTSKIITSSVKEH